MREYGQVQCAFWQSDLGNLTDDGKLLALYLMTGPHSNGSGCYPCPIEYVMGDLRWSSERVSERFNELSQNHFAYRFGTVVFIRKYLAWNPVANANVALARMKEFRALPSGDGKALLAMAILRYCKHFSAEYQAELQEASRTVTQTVSQTVWQTRSDPIRPDPDPTREDPNTPRVREKAAEADEGAKLDAGATATHRASAGATEAVSRWERELEATYPQTRHGRNCAAGAHRALGLIGSGKITDERLRDQVRRFRAFVDSGGYSDASKVPSLHAWLEQHCEDPYWNRDWTPVPTKAEQRQDANVTAVEQFLNRDRASA